MSLPVECRSDIAFGSYIMNREPLIVDEIRTYSAPAQIVNRLSRITRPGSTVSQIRYDEKIVEVIGRIVARKRDRETMVRQTDRLKRELESGANNLLVGYLDHRYYSMALIVDAVKIDWLEESSHVIGWSAQFLCADPFLYAESEETESDSEPMVLVSGTEYVKTLELAAGGTAYSYPVITIEIDDDLFAVSSIWVVNVDSIPQEQITVTREFHFGDVLVIDGPAMRVTLNGSEIDYSGQFPALDRRLGVTNTFEIHTLATEASGLWQIGVSVLGVGTYVG